MPIIIIIKTFCANLSCLEVEIGTETVIECETETGIVIGTGIETEKEIVIGKEIETVRNDVEKIVLVIRVQEGKCGNFTNCQ